MTYTVAMFIATMFTVAVLGGLEEARRMLMAYLTHQRELKQQEHQTRRIEALALMDEPARNRLLETMPDWLDRDDPDDVEAWKRARAETNRLTEKNR